MISSSIEPKAKCKVKKNGQVYTPDFIVKNILDLVGYSGKCILRRHIIENSCGDGAFLIEVLRRYLAQCEKGKIAKDEVRRQLETYIHGIELDEEEHAKCIANLNALADEYGISDVSWDIRCQDAMDCDCYDGKMDYVVGNPPYVRIHNLGQRGHIKQFDFAKMGMTDLYLVFFEIGLRMIKKDGVLGYITPSSYFNSSAGSVMRSYFVKNNLLNAVVDLKHYQAFSATTYTAITVLKNGSQNVDYYEYDEREKAPVFVCNLSSDDYCINGSFYFSSKDNLLSLRKIIDNNRSYRETISVKNGFATLADGVFISDEFEFDEYVIPVIKSSTGEKKKCFFPYKNNKIVPLDNLINDEKIKSFLLNNEDVLKKRSITNEELWYGFGRTQAINDVYKNKYAISGLLRNLEDIKIVPCRAGTGVYGGLYILSDLPLKTVKSLVKNDGFAKYVRLLGKYKSGGYYTYSSKDVERFIDYKMSEVEND